MNAIDPGASGGATSVLCESEPHAKPAAAASEVEVARGRDGWAHGLMLALLLANVPLPSPLYVAGYLRPANVLVVILVATVRAPTSWGEWLRAIAAGAIVGLVPRDPLLVFAPHAVVAAALLLAPRGRDAAAGARVIGGALVATVALLVQWAVPATRRALDAVAVAFNFPAGAGGHELPWLSLDYADLSLAWVVAVFVLTQPSRRRWGRAAAAALVLGAVAYVTHLVTRIASMDGQRPPAATVAGACRTVALVALLVAYARRRTATEPAVRSTLPRRRVAWIATAVAAVSLAGAVVALRVRPLEDRALRCVVVDRGLITWSTAQYGEYGDFSIGMFGELARYCAVDHVTVDTRFKDEAIRAQDLDGYDLLVLINDGVPWKDGEIDAVRRMLRRGGGVLALCDHTDVAGQLAVVNALTGPLGIELRFDSAYPEGDPFWNGSMLAPAHPATIGLWDSAFRHAVGCSLALSGGARPLLVGRYGLSDNGSHENASGAFLGNYRFDAGERRGGLVLGAEAAEGAGRLVVLGDTSAFQNAGMPSYWTFVRRLLRYSAGDTGFVWAQGGALVALAFLAILGALLADATAVRPLLVAAVAVGAAVLALGRGADAAAAPPSSRDGGGRTVLLETSGGRRGSTHESRYRIEGDGEFATALMRNGCLVYRDTLERAPVRPDVVVVDDPAFPLPSAVQQRLLAAARSGKAVWLVVGHESASFVGEVLEAVGLEIAPRLLGNEQETSPVYYGRAAPPPRFGEPWEVVVSREAQTRVALAGRPVVVTSSLGAGSVTLIADPLFLRNRNLDLSRGGSPGAHYLLASLLEQSGIRIDPRITGAK